jgi:putative transposase
LTGSVKEKRALIDPSHPDLSIRRQCALLGLNRAAYYYEPVPEDLLNLELMRRIDAQYLKTPFYGWPKMAVALRAQGYHVNGKRVRRLMRQMGLHAITVRKRPATSTPGHRIYPYLLRNVTVEQPNQVWCADITFVPMPLGFVYLVVSWIGSAAMSWPGSSRTAWRAASVARPCSRRSGVERP